jgi:hypothetical protein
MANGQTFELVAALAVLILGFSGDDIWQHILGNTQLLLW